MHDKIISEATQNWQCIWTVWQSKNYLDAKKACMAAFYSNTFNTPNDVCIAGQGLAVCLSQQFIAAAAPCNINDVCYNKKVSRIKLLKF